MFNPKKILVPVDFSDCSKSALEYAVSIAWCFQGTVDVLHVWEAPPAGYQDVQALHWVLDDVRQEAREELDEFIEATVKTDVAVRPLLQLGDPQEAILRHAAKGGYDLLVMGTHGRTGLAHLFLGSVAERVVRQSRTPVLTIHQTDDVKTAAA